jgi:hypothetical protein
MISIYPIIILWVVATYKIVNHILFYENILLILKEGTDSKVSELFGG